MSEIGKRVLKTAIIGIVLAIVVMGFNIWMAYNTCNANGLDTYSVEALSMEIYAITKNGNELIGTPNIANMGLVTVVYMVVLIAANELAHASSKSSKDARTKQLEKKDKKEKKDIFNL